MSEIYGCLYALQVRGVSPGCFVSMLSDFDKMAADPHILGDAPPIRHKSKSTRDRAFLDTPSIQVADS